MKSKLGPPMSAAQRKAALDELDKWLKGQPSAFRKVPVKTVPRNRIRAVRQESHLTQEKFAAVLGVNAATVRFWESGRRSPVGLARKVLRLIEKRPELVLELAKV